jgi:hypothetical protein
MEIFTAISLFIEETNKHESVKFAGEVKRVMLKKSYCLIWVEKAVGCVLSLLF